MENKSISSNFMMFHIMLKFFFIHTHYREIFKYILKNYMKKIVYILKPRVRSVPPTVLINIIVVLVTLNSLLCIDIDVKSYARRFVTLYRC